jgi:chemotaxis signal transduction protein
MSGGVVFRTSQDALCFLPATIAIKVLAIPDLARVPGAPPDLLGVALVDGDMVPVVAIGHARSAMIVCSYLGERLGLVGMEIVTAGRIEAGEGKLFDVASVIAKLRDARWTGWAV